MLLCLDTAVGAMSVADVIWSPVSLSTRECLFYSLVMIVAMSSSWMLKDGLVSSSTNTSGQDASVVRSLLNLRLNWKGL